MSGLPSGKCFSLLSLLFSLVVVCLTYVFRLHSPSGTVYNGLALGDWISHQIKAFRDCRLTSTRQKLLEEIGYRETFSKIMKEKRIINDIERDEEESKRKEIAEQEEAMRRRKRQEELLKDPWNRMFVALLQYKKSAGTSYW
jgi:hypothetical protein